MVDKHAGIVKAETLKSFSRLPGIVLKARFFVPKKTRKARSWINGAKDSPDDGDPRLQHCPSRVKDRTDFHAKNS